MTAAVEHSEVFSTYGAFELKSTYRRHLMYAIGAAALLHFVVVGALSVALKPPVDSESTTSRRRIIVPDQPPMPSLVTEQRFDLGTVAVPAVVLPGIPDPVEDESIVVQPAFERVTEFVGIDTPVGAGMSGGTSSDPVGFLGAGAGLDEYLPPPDEFIEFDDPPRIARMVNPEYPEVARLTGQEGDVWIRALVDTQGEVRDVQVAKSSGSAAGFDAAALAAAWEIRYVPATQNGHPVAVWVTYKVSFRLK